MKTKITNKTDINNHVFTTFLVFMAAMVELVVIIALSLQLNSIDDKNIQNSTSYINKDLITFEMLPEGIREKYRLRQPSSILEKIIPKGKGRLGNYRKDLVEYVDGKKIIFISKVSCPDMIFGSTQSSSACMLNLENFFNNSTKDMIFEVVSLVQSSDLIDMGKVVNLLSSTEYKKYYLNQNIINNFTQYTRDGLAQNRIQEGIIQIRKYMGEDVKIRFSPFHKFSDNQSGFTIKAYNVL